MTSHTNKKDYEKIRKSIEDTWPDWKKELCNERLLISVHSKKLRVDKNKGEQ